MFVIHMIVAVLACAFLYAFIAYENGKLSRELGMRTAFTECINGLQDVASNYHDETSLSRVFYCSVNALNKTGECSVKRLEMYNWAIRKIYDGTIHVLHSCDIKNPCLYTPPKKRNFLYDACSSWSEYVGCLRIRKCKKKHVNLLLLNMSLSVENAVCTNSCRLTIRDPQSPGEDVTREKMKPKTESSGLGYAGYIAPALAIIAAVALILRCRYGARGNVPDHLAED